MRERRVSWKGYGSLVPGIDILGFVIVGCGEVWSTWFTWFGRGAWRRGWAGVFDKFTGCCNGFRNLEIEQEGGGEGEPFTAL